RVKCTAEQPPGQRPGAPEFAARVGEEGRGGRCPGRRQREREIALPFTAGAGSACTGPEGRARKPGPACFSYRTIIPWMGIRTMPRAGSLELITTTPFAARWARKVRSIAALSPGARVKLSEPAATAKSVLSAGRSETVP